MPQLTVKRIFLALLVLITIIGTIYLVRELQNQQEIRSRAAGEAVYFSFTPVSQNIIINNTGTFEVKLHAATNNITGVDVTFAYDKANISTVQWEEVNTGFSVILNEGLVNTANGTIRYTAVNTNASTMPQIITLGKIKLTAKSLGTGGIIIQSAQVTADAIDSALPLGTSTPASFTIIASPTATPTRTPTPLPTNTPTPVPTKAPVEGDYNGDYTVDVLDFNIWRDEYLGVLTTKNSDANKDGVIDLIDFAIWKNRFTSGN